MSLPAATSFDLSPVRMSYVAALRNIVPASLDAPFTYAATGDIDVEKFLCLTASNPQGRFYAVLRSNEMVQKATELASLRSVANATFLANTNDIPSGLSYYCHESAGTMLSVDERKAVCASMAAKLGNGGIACLRYTAYDNPDETLRFLINEYEADLSDADALEFLDELKALGSSYFQQHPIAQNALDKAIANKDPKSFFTACGSGQSTRSGTFETMEAMLPSGFAFVCDAEISRNYLDLVAPPASHETLMKCKNHLMYEPIKDFVLQRLDRADVWVKMPAPLSSDNVHLFDTFTFGITMPTDKIPDEITTQSGSISLKTPLYMRLVELMSTLPTGIGDFLSHPMGLGFAPDEVLGAIQLIVASGIAQPMRSRFERKVSTVGATPRWATPFNNYLTHAPISSPQITVASSIVGEGVVISLRDALVLQAVSKAGILKSPSVLGPELNRILQMSPALAAQITESGEATDEVVKSILSSTLANNMSRWFAYGLLAA